VSTEQNANVARVLEHWRAEVRHSGFCYVPAHQMRAALPEAALGSWPQFAASWHALALDNYMADAGRYRKRRHAVFHVRAAKAQNGAHLDVHVTRQPAAPHFQSVDYNPLNGGIARHFAPIAPAIAQGAMLQALLARFAELVAPLVAAKTPENPPASVLWRAEAHQFRIEPTPEHAGLPTPEGVHRDGVDYVLVMMIARENIAAGTTTVHTNSGGATAEAKPEKQSPEAKPEKRSPEAKPEKQSQIGSFTLATPFEAVWLDDNRLFHGVTAVHAKDPALPAFRDVLVLTLKAHPL
jgi:hypothetical protein